MPDFSNAFNQLIKKDRAKKNKGSRETVIETGHLTTKLHVYSLLGLIFETEVLLKETLVADATNTENDFAECVNVLKASGMTGELLIKRWTKDRTDNPMSPVMDWYIALAYYIEASELAFKGATSSSEVMLEDAPYLTKDARDDAWSNLAKARFFCGRASALSQFPLAMRLESKHFGRLGAKKYQNSPMCRLETEALRYVRTLEQKTLFKTEAAKKTRDHLNNYAVKHQLCASLSIEDSGVKTVSKWLSRMPDAAKIFKTKKEIRAHRISKKQQIIGLQ